MQLRKILANTLRILSIDAIQNANSGHPGAPMGMADIAEVLWRNYINHNPNNPKWINRDRFILSNGHASMLLYSILHLTGYNISIEDLKNFRQLHSKTPGHPEYSETDGVESTTGPLGQGLANAIGFAIGEKTLASQFNKPNYNIIDHYTYVFAGDGCMMEGISHEACSLAGTLKLGKLLVFYDDNGISIDGQVKNWFNDDTALRFQAYGWHVINNINGHDSQSIEKAIEISRNILHKPSLLICKTTIAYGSANKEGTHQAHGSPLGTEEIAQTRKKLNWNFPPFVIPKNIYQYWNAEKQGNKKEENWKQKFASYAKHYPALAQELIRRINNKLPNMWEKYSTKIIHDMQKKTTNISTRQASQNILQKLYPILPEIFGGSADLAPSNLTIVPLSKPINKYPNGNYIHYGVREFGMTAIGNGIANYGGFIPYTATFLIFTEYAKNAIRMAALMKIKHIMVYTHDSIGLGEDGPTHQPIEQLSSMRMTPNLTIWRPCDQTETAVAWKQAIENNHGPTALILSRQNLQYNKRNQQQIDNICKGGYILKGSHENKHLDLIIISTGSEIELAVETYKILTKENYKIRVVSLPSTNIFDIQSKEYKESVLPQNITNRLAIEAGNSVYWYKYVGLQGYIMGINEFGKSAPYKKLFDFFGLTVKKILKKSHELLKKNKNKM
ncbi:MAG: transketolase 1 [Candidatus Westeberhardia cardiocondylae]|nr:transketolase 1 [Candidatus Westeberhardia cardiocondylae]